MKIITWNVNSVHAHAASGALLVVGKAL